MSRLKNLGDGNRQIVALSESKPSATAGTAGAIVEFKEPDGPLLREDEEDLEVKLRRIIEHVPVRVSNTSGSSAGSGSGDFHQYRQMRRREQDRLSRMDVDYERRKELAEFNAKREERIKAAEERTAKKRAKRQKQKEKRRQKKKKPDNSASDQAEKAQVDLAEEDSTDSDSADEGLDRATEGLQIRPRINVS
uniref:TSA: Wollemia nobilis Ref_Wollemi_Transcript_15931_769 transcribed RNA sequence n=1 Tax=Wollemia nobilis TaxID=56998 RepID=A0A0C9RIK3_9CONI